MNKGLFHVTILQPKIIQQCNGYTFEMTDGSLVPHFTKIVIKKFLYMSGKNVAVLC